MDCKSIQHVNKKSSDELLNKFSDTGSDSGDEATSRKTESRFLNRRKKRRTTSSEVSVGCSRNGGCGGGGLVERKRLLPPVGTVRRSSALIRQIGIFRSSVKTRDLIKSRLIMRSIGKTWHKTIEGASKVFMEKHYNKHKRLINDVV